MQKAESDQSVSEMMDSSDDESCGAINDDIISEVDMRTSFVMSSSILGKNNRRKRMLA
jgi:hypothetical protein